MAFLVAGGGEYPPFRPGSPYHPAKRRITDAVDDEHHFSKRPRYAQFPQFGEPVAFKSVDEPSPSYPPLHHPRAHHRQYLSPAPGLSSPEPVGPAPAPAMERTASGHSIRADPTERCGSTELLEDHEAAQRVREHLAAFRRRNPDSKHERILRSIIYPRHPPRRRHHHHQHQHHQHQNHQHQNHQHQNHQHQNHQHHYAPEDASFSEKEAREEYPLDNAALESIFSTANEIFFNGRLSQRVTWDWSHASSARYDARVIGTTALRRAAASTRGFETLVVLSSPILRDPRFSRRLLISTFLHELIHSYLFICCGFRARWCGGHTPGFRDIAAVIDDWAGKESGLYLSRVEADLELFRIGRRVGCGEEAGGDGDGRRGETGCAPGAAFGEARVERERLDIYRCSGMTAEHDEYADAAAAASAAAGPDHRETIYFVTGTAPSSVGYGAWGQEKTVDPVDPGGNRGSLSPGSYGGSRHITSHRYNDYAGDGTHGGCSDSNSSSSSSVNGGEDRWTQRRSFRPRHVLP